MICITGKYAKPPVTMCTLFTKNMLHVYSLQWGKCSAKKKFQFFFNQSGFWGYSGMIFCPLLFKNDVFHILPHFLVFLWKFCDAKNLCPYDYLFTPRPPWYIGAIPLGPVCGGGIPSCCWGAGTGGLVYPWGGPCWGGCC